MENKLTRKDFINYLAKGGSAEFNKPIKLNKAQLSKLTKDQIDGREPIYIEGKKGYLDGKGFWEPISKSKNTLKQQVAY